MCREYKLDGELNLVKNVYRVSTEQHHVDTKSGFSRSKNATILQAR